MDFAAFFNGQYHRIQFNLHAGLSEQVDKAAGVFRTGKFFFKIMQPKSVVDALVQNATQFFIPFQDEHTFGTLFPGFARCRQAGRAAADYDYFNFHGFSPPFLFRR